MAQGCNGDVGGLESLRPRKWLLGPGAPMGAPPVLTRVDLIVGKPPAVAGVAVAMPRVIEAILQRLADVLGRKGQPRRSPRREGRGPTHSARVFCPRSPVILSPAQQR